mmetsp:Transcript_90418/g.189120  ORF Transcript_90418/g.189120 Transcript_90418/m.189120 type:complete len:265 (+) Transcript_90418:1034-1828(+)
MQVCRSGTELLLEDEEEEDDGARTDGTEGSPWFCHNTPAGVTTRASSTMSSIFPYLARFMPLARVAIQPPSVENSMESGSMPMVTPSLAKALLRATPVMPAWIWATPSSLLTQRTFASPFMSRATKGRGSVSMLGSWVALMTLVPPPTGMTAKSRSFASAKTASTSTSDSGLSTASGRRGTSRVRSFHMSASPCPVVARNRASKVVEIRSSGSTCIRFFTRPSCGGAASGKGASGNVSPTRIVTDKCLCQKFHNSNIGLFPKAA